MSKRENEKEDDKKNAEKEFVEEINAIADKSFEKILQNMEKIWKKLFLK